MRRSTCRILVGKSEGKIPLGRLMRKWVGNIKIDLGNLGCGGMDLIDFVQDGDQWWTVVSTVKNLLDP
jgi:hypothetical protein